MEMCTSLDVVHRRCRALGGQEIVLNSLGNHAALGTMVGQQLGLSEDQMREVPLQRGYDAAMKLSTPTPQQSAVCGIFQQGMFE
jgi:hypothetical protein